TGKLLLHVERPAMPRCCRVSPDGRLLVWGDEEGRVGVVDFYTGRELRRFEGHRGAVTSLAFLAEGRTLVSGSAASTALFWDVSACRPRPDATPPSPAQLARLWDALADSSAATAHRAVGAFVAAPSHAVPFLAGRLRPVAHPDPARVRRLLTDLG